MIRVVCDLCEKPIKMHRRKGPQISRTKEWNTSKLFPHLCENCAAKIDNVLREFKGSTTQAHLTSQYYAKLNAERRERLGTDG